MVRHSLLKYSIIPRTLAAEFGEMDYKIQNILYAIKTRFSIVPRIKNDNYNTKIFLENILSAKGT